MVHSIECCQLCSKQNACEIMKLTISHCKASMVQTTFSISNVTPTTNSQLNITIELHGTPMLLSNKSELIPVLMSGYIRLHSRTIDSLLTSRPHFRHLWTWICFIPKRRVISVSSSCSSLAELVFPFSCLSPFHMQHKEMNLILSQTTATTIHKLFWNKWYVKTSCTFSPQDVGYYYLDDK